MFSRFKIRKKFLPQVRLELTTPALLNVQSTVYKYRALTDCATGDGCHLGRFCATQAGSSLDGADNATFT